MIDIVRRGAKDYKYNGVSDFLLREMLFEQMVKKRLVENPVLIDWQVLEEVGHFCYLGNFLDCEGIERAVKSSFSMAEMGSEV